MLPQSCHAQRGSKVVSPGPGAPDLLCDLNIYNDIYDHRFYIDKSNPLSV